jgi:D12 class N6 adenine-specific DNA methyltransferase
MDETIPLPAPVIHRVSHSPRQMSETTRGLFKCHGGKFYLSRDILTVCHQAMRSCDEWIEGCAGGGNWSVQSPQLDGVRQVVNDLDPLAANAWRVATDPALSFGLFNRLCDVAKAAQDELTTHAQWQAATLVCMTFAKAKTLADLDEAMGDGNAKAATAIAAAYIVNHNMSRGGMGTDFTWSARERGEQAETINAFETYVRQFPKLAARVKGWHAQSHPVINVIKDRHQRQQTFIYLDPPYLPQVRTVSAVYGHEMSDDQHWAMISAMRGARCKIALSGYDSEMYRAYLTREQGWTLHQFAIKNNSGQTAKKGDRVECLWTNF